MYINLYAQLYTSTVIYAHPYVGIHVDLSCRSLKKRRVRMPGDLALKGYTGMIEFQIEYEDREHAYKQSLVNTSLENACMPLYAHCCCMRMEHAHI